MSETAILIIFFPVLSVAFLCGFVKCSCEPNLMNYEVLVESMDCQLAHIGFFAKRDVSPSICILAMHGNCRSTCTYLDLIGTCLQERTVVYFVD